MLLLVWLIAGSGSALLAVRKELNRMLLLVLLIAGSGSALPYSVGQTGKGRTLTLHVCGRR